MGSGCGGKSAKKRKLSSRTLSYIVEHGFHECNSNLSLLHEIILGVLDL
jgi:hypothetical protein